MNIKNSLECWLGNPIKYERLSGKEQESYNAALLVAQMAQWGYLESQKINGDKHGADMIFYRSSDAKVLKIQLKGRVTLSKSYAGKDILVAFRDRKSKSWFLYDHDIVLEKVLSLGYLAGTSSWEKTGGWSWSSNPSWLQEIMNDWKIS